MEHNMSYDSILERILTHLEEIAEMDGQDGDVEIYELRMEIASKFREGLKSFKEDYRINTPETKAFLPEFFRIMSTEYGCDNAEFLSWALPAYIQSKQKEKESIEQELRAVAIFKDVLSE